MHTVLITGVSAGLGDALAARYLRAGSTVLGLNRRRPEALIAEGLCFESADLRDFESVPFALKRLLANHRRVDMAILNAADLGQFGDIQDQSIRQMKSTMDTNLWGNKLVLEVLFELLDEISQVLVISTGASKRPKRGMAAYSISKAALNVMTELWAQEKPDTHFTLVGPGPINTAMQESLCSHAPSPEFPVIESLLARRDDFPSPGQVADAIIATAPQWMSNQASGEYVDLRISSTPPSHLGRHSQADRPSETDG